MADEHLKGQGAIGGWPELFRVQDCRAGFSKYQLGPSLPEPDKNAVYTSKYSVNFFTQNFKMQTPSRIELTSQSTL
jgi:hypothetical protein